MTIQEILQRLEALGSEKVPVKIKFVLFLLLFFLSDPGFAQVKIIAHRGASYLAPENTLASARLAFELGADAVEADVWLSGDHKIMVIHNRNTKRISGKDHVVPETPADVLRSLDAGSHKNEKFSGEKIPFLKELLDILPDGKNLVIHIKTTSEIVPELVRLTEGSNKRDQLIFICVDFQTIAHVKQAFPGNKCYWLVSEEQVFMEKIGEVKAQNLDGVNLQHDIVQEKLMNRADSLGLEVITYTINDREEAKRVIKLGVTAITTDRPGWLRSELSKL